MYKTFFFLFLALFSIHNLNGQTFKAGAFFGLSASQINGDNSAGFNKPGLEGGLKVLVRLNDKIDLGLELQYSQRGAKESTEVDGTPQNIYKTNFVAVPVIFTFKDWKTEEYYKLHFHGGLSYGRLVDAELINDVDNELFISTWKKNDLSYLLGATYFLNENFGLTVRYNRSLFLLFKAGSSAIDPNATDPDNNIVTFNTNSLIPHHLSFHGLYMF